MPDSYFLHLSSNERNNSCWNSNSTHQLLFVTPTTDPIEKRILSNCWKEGRELFSLSLLILAASICVCASVLRSCSNDETNCTNLYPVDHQNIQFLGYMKLTPEVIRRPRSTRFIKEDIMSFLAKSNKLNEILCLILNFFFLIQMVEKIILNSIPKVTGSHCK